MTGFLSASSSREGASKRSVLGPLEFPGQVPLLDLGVERVLHQFFLCKEGLPCVSASG